MVEILNLGLGALEEENYPSGALQPERETTRKQHCLLATGRNYSKHQVEGHRASVAGGIGGIDAVLDARQPILFLDPTPEMLDIPLCVHSILLGVPSPVLPSNQLTKLSQRKCRVHIDPTQTL